MSFPAFRSDGWTRVLVGPILSLLVFLAAYFVDPLNFGSQQPMAALPAFFLAVLVLIIEHNLTTQREVREALQFSDRIYEAVRNYLHVTSMGSPEEATRYIVARLPVLREVKNTTFNVRDEQERAEEKLYHSDAYKELARAVATACGQGLLWKDVGDLLAVKRLRATSKMFRETGAERTNYKYRLIRHREPQINFIILEYRDGRDEVLFNWDFRGTGQDPKVLLSRDRQILEMFSVQFTLLWRVANEDSSEVND